LSVEAGVSAVPVGAGEAGDGDGDEAASRSERAGCARPEQGVVSVIERAMWWWQRRRNRRTGHAENCDGWHHPVTGHCGDCGCFTCAGVS
jgi:hypothetical protein